MAIIFEAASTYAEYLSANPEIAAPMEGRQKEVHLSASDQLYLAAYPQSIHMVVVAKPNCPSTIVVVPILVKLARASARISFWLVDAESGKDLIESCVEEQDLSGELAAALAAIDQPLLIVLDVDHSYLGHWKPHPASFKPFMEEWRQRHPQAQESSRSSRRATRCGGFTEVELSLINEMRLWYNSGLDQDCVAEVRSLLEQVDTTIEDDETG